MLDKFPRTTVGGLSLPRMLIGTNWLLGWSHTSAAADAIIRNQNDSAAAMFPVLETFMDFGIDAVMAPISTQPLMIDALKYAEDKLGKKFIKIDTPAMNVSNTAEARKEAEAVIKNSAAVGSDFCLIHHSSAEELVNKNTRTIDRLPDYLSMIRENGMRPGLSAHMPELIQYSDANEYDVETYIQIFNCMGFLMQIEIETIAKIIHSAKKPVMTIKSMAAGRCSPYVGITFSYAALRECDMVTVGCMTAREASEDIEIGLAALEHRMPVLEGRSSPNKTSIITGQM